VLVAVPFSAALAQIETGGVDKRAANTRAARNAEKNKTKQATENPYPNATRNEPEAKASSKLGKKIDKAVKALYDEKYDEAEQNFNDVLADAKANDYEKAMAYQGLANIANDRDDDVARVLEYTKKSLDLNALPNVTHFGALLQYANLSMSEEKYADAVTTIDQLAGCKAVPRRTLPTPSRRSRCIASRSSTRPRPPSARRSRCPRSRTRAGTSC
jgi:hypothetical protein